MEEVEENESKGFDAELAPNGEDAQPEPDEHMITDSATGRVWIVKVRNHARFVDPRSSHIFWAAHRRSRDS